MTYPYAQFVTRMDSSLFEARVDSSRAHTEYSAHAEYSAHVMYVKSHVISVSLSTLIERKTPPGGVSYLLCSLIKNRE